MAALPRCPSCRGFVPPVAAACPHCGIEPSTGGRGVGFWLKAAGAGAVSVTMMACYGVPPDGPYPDDSSSGGSGTLTTEDSGTRDTGASGGNASSGTAATGEAASESSGDSSGGVGASAPLPPASR